MEPWLTKLIALVLTLVATLIAGLLPLKLITIIQPAEGCGNESRSRLRADVILSILNCFSGGVFLAVTMLHLLPDVRHDFQGVFKSLEHKTDFPMAEFIACLGFFIVMLIENLIVQYQRSTAVTKPDSSSNCVVRVDDDPVGSIEEAMPIIDSHCDEPDSTGSDSGITDGTGRRERSTRTAIPSNQRQVPYGSVEHSCHNDLQHTAQRLYSSVESEQPRSQGRDPARRHRDARTSSGTVARYESLPTSGPEVNRFQRQWSHGSVTDDGALTKPEGGHSYDGGHSHDHSHGIVMDTDGKVHSLRSLVLLIALSIHTIFEGMALGLQESTGEVWTLFIAIIVHKVIMAFTVGLRFIESLRSVRTTIIYVIIFSITSPIGIGIGLLVSEAGSNDFVTTVISAALQGIATGTFLYVTFFEVLLEEMTNNQNSGKVLAVVIGFTCITLLELFGEHGDG